MDGGMVDHPSDFVAETDRQVDEAIRSLRRLDGLQPEAWETLAPVERLALLQRVEEVLATIQGRPATMVFAREDMDPGEFGAFDGESIIVNEGHLLGRVPVSDLVDTVIHEGRHAFQQYAIEHPGFVTDDEIVVAWDDNFDNYLDAPTYGQELYEAQPIEADAWSYAAHIRGALYDDG